MSTDEASNLRSALAPPPAADDSQPDSVKFLGGASTGALGLGRAALDTAFAKGYARGLEEARADALDQWRTTLLSMLEGSFGDLDDSILDRIEQGDQATLERWVKAVPKASSVEEVMGTC